MSKLAIGSVLKDQYCRAESGISVDPDLPDGPDVYQDFTIIGETPGTLTEPPYWKVRCNSCGHKTEFKKQESE